MESVAEHPALSIWTQISPPCWTLYSALVAVLLVYFEANVLLSVVFLSVLPAALMWWYEKLHTRVVAIALVVSAGLTFIYESTAYINGIWYATSPSEWRVFDLFPVEAFVAAFAHFLFFIVAYEYFFDDRQSSKKKLQRGTAYALGLAGFLFTLALAYVYLFSNLILTNAFAWIILDLIALIVIVCALARRYVGRVLGKVSLFALSMVPLSLTYEYVALSNNLRFFANPNEYVYSFTVLNQIVPLEELLFLLLLPFVIALVYELYLDDGR